MVIPGPAPHPHPFLFLLHSKALAWAHFSVFDPSIPFQIDLTCSLSPTSQILGSISGIILTSGVSQLFIFKLNFLTSFLLTQPGDWVTKENMVTASNLVSPP